MFDLLRAAAAAVPDHVAVRTDLGDTTYADLLVDARRVSAGLAAHGLERAVVVEPDAGWILRLLCGASHAGVELCLLQPDIPGTEVVDVATRMGATAVISRRTDVDGLPVLEPDALRAHEPAEADAATESHVLIRTTGTTGEPKIAQHSWQSLGRTVQQVRPRPDQAWLLAYGPQQFAGIQVLLHVLAAQATLVAPFPRQPRDGLQALLGGGVTCVSATPTYWKFLLIEARSLEADLPPLEQITLGGEASSPALLDELATVFPTARVTQVYASTELGSVASVSDGRPGLSIEQFWSPERPDAQLRIEDGELWVRADAAMVGYVGVDDDRRSTDDGWWPSGDRVEIVGDRVEFRGRISEIINVGGVKVHPLPVEERISAVPGVDMVRVHGRPNPMVGAVVAADIVAAPGADPAQLKAAVRDAVGDLPRAWHPRSITFVDEIVTVGNKTLRSAES